MPHWPYDRLASPVEAVAQLSPTAREFSRQRSAILRLRARAARLASVAFSALRGNPPH